MDAHVHFSSLTCTQWPQFKWELLKCIDSGRVTLGHGKTYALLRSYGSLGVCCDFFWTSPHEWMLLLQTKEANQLLLKSRAALSSCCHNPVWMQRSPLNTLILTLTQARSYSHCWKGTCAALLHTRVQDNLSMDNMYDALIFLPLTGLFHRMAAAEVWTDIWSVAVLRVSSPIWIRNQRREPCSVICLWRLPLHLPIPSPGAY